MSENQINKVVDVVVIGAGPGGMTAALYASRANLKTLIIEKGAPGGEMLNTAEVENYPGFPLTTGPELAQLMYEGAIKFGAEHIYGDVVKLEVKGDERLVYTATEVYQAKAVIIATGSTHRHLGVPGEEAYSGAGVSYCAVCDGFFFRGKHVVVVGGGDSAVEEGTYLTQFADKVTIIHRRDSLRAQKLLQDRAFANPKIEFIWDTVVEAIEGEQGQVTQLQLRQVKTGQTSVLPADGVFIYVGLLPNSKVAQGLNITDEEGWIITDEKMRTQLPGIYAIGDVRAQQLRQIATAVGNGAIAGQEVYQYIENLAD